jgi:hypothetical protein
MTNDPAHRFGPKRVFTWLYDFINDTQMWDGVLMAIFITLVGTLVILGFFIIGAIERSKEHAAMQPRQEQRIQFQQHAPSPNNAQLGLGYHNSFGQPNLVPQQTIYCPPQTLVQNYPTSIHERFGKSRHEAARDKQWISPFGEPNGRAEAANERPWF